MCIGYFTKLNLASLYTSFFGQMFTLTVKVNSFSLRIPIFFHYKLYLRFHCEERGLITKEGGIDFCAVI